MKETLHIILANIVLWEKYIILILAVFMMIYNILLVNMINNLITKVLQKLKLKHKIIF